jgi:uncharacterized protein (DUF952 family)
MTIIYHLAPATRWLSWPTGTSYLPAEFEQEGFIHCTLGDELMLKVAQQYRRHTPGDFVLLVIDTDKLLDPPSPIKWEKSSVFAELFPHIYGPIDRNAIVSVRTVQRADDGTFLGWSNA